MRHGRVFKRCSNSGCRATVERRKYERCGSERFTWYFVVDIGAASGPRDQKLKGGFPTKRAALEAMHELQHAVSRGAYVAPSKLTVGEYLLEWLPTAGPAYGPAPTTLANSMSTVTSGHGSATCRCSRLPRRA